LVGQVEQLMQTRVAHVGIDQQGATWQLREGCGQVGSKVRFAVTAVGAQHGQGRARALLAVQLHDQVAAYCTEGFGFIGEWPCGHHQFRVECAATFRRVGVVKLLSQCPQHIVCIGQAQCHGRFTEANTILALIGEDLLDLIGRQLIGFTDDLANGPLCAQVCRLGELGFLLCPWQWFEV